MVVETRHRCGVVQATLQLFASIINLFCVTIDGFAVAINSLAIALDPLTIVVDTLTVIRNLAVICLAHVVAINLIDSDYIVG